MALDQILQVITDDVFSVLFVIEEFLRHTHLDLFDLVVFQVVGQNGRDTDGHVKSRQILLFFFIDFGGVDTHVLKEGLGKTLADFPATVFVKSQRGADREILVAMGELR